MLIDVLYEPLDFIYRVFGTGIATAHRKDFTGKSVREIEPSEFSDVIWKQYSEVLENKGPLLHGVTFVTDERYLKYFRLTLPLSSKGVVIDQLLAVSIEDGRFWEAVDNTEFSSTD
jgi:hypothetical protein